MNEKILTLLNEVRSDIKIMKKDIQSLKDDVHDVKIDVNTLKTEQANIKIAFLDLSDTGEKVDSLTAIQESQQHIIDLLSTRSIEQEADIKDLKLKTS